MECSFCDSKEVVLSAGYRYCSKCLWRFDETIINSWIAMHFPLTLYRIVQLCRDLFGSEHYKLSDFHKLYQYADRGPWLEKQRRFQIPQEQYLVAAFKQFLIKKHTPTAEKLDLC